MQIASSTRLRPRTTPRPNPAPVKQESPADSFTFGSMDSFPSGALVLGAVTGTVAGLAAGTDGWVGGIAGAATGCVGGAFSAMHAHSKMRPGETGLSGLASFVTYSAGGAALGTVAGSYVGASFGHPVAGIATGVGLAAYFLMN